jgi:hypothetical protein
VRNSGNLLLRTLCWSIERQNLFNSKTGMPRELGEFVGIVVSST